MNFRKKKILVTGASGFVARNIAASMNTEEFRLYGLSRHPRKDEIWEHSYPIDITKPFSLREHFDAVIHLAAFNRTHIGAGESYQQYYDVNVKGTEHVAAGCSYDKFIFMSTASLYRKTGGVADETAEIEAKGYYARSKEEAEQICGQIIPEEKRVILRSVNVAGPGQGRVALLPVLFHNARKGEALNIFVPENRIMQFVHVTDLARILERIIRMDRSGVYNATGTEAVEIRQLAEKVLELCRSSSKLLTSGEFEKTVTICGEKLRGETGWEPKMPLESILEEQMKETDI